MTTRSAHAALLVSLAIAAGPGAGAAELSSPMVDRAVFRTGAVQRTNRRFDRWILVCDDIRALGRRYCSLRSAPASDAGGLPFYVDVSTGDDGRPAALVHLPTAISLSFGVTNVAVGAVPARPRGKAASRADERRIAVAACNPRECLAVWSLRATEIAALKEGAGLRFTYCGTGAEKLEFAVNLRERSCARRTTALLAGSGFSKALQASLQ